MDDALTELLRAPPGGLRIDATLDRVDIPIPMEGGPGDPTTLLAGVAFAMTVGLIAALVAAQRWVPVVHGAINGVSLVCLCLLLVGAGAIALGAIGSASGRAPQPIRLDGKQVTIARHAVALHTITGVVVAPAKPRSVVPGTVTLQRSQREALVWEVRGVSPAHLRWLAQVIEAAAEASRTKRGSSREVPAEMEALTARRAQERRPDRV